MLLAMVDFVVDGVDLGSEVIDLHIQASTFDVTVEELHIVTPDTMIVLTKPVIPPFISVARVGRDILDSRVRGETSALFRRA